MNNPAINDAVRKLRHYNDDERARELAFKRARAVTDYNHRYEKGIDKGIEKERVRNILKLHKYGLNTNEISDALSISADEVQRIIDSNKEAKNDWFWKNEYFKKRA